MSMVGSNDMRVMISEFIEDFEEKRFNKKKKQDNKINYITSVYEI